MYSVVESGIAIASQLQVDLMDQCGRPQGMSGTLSTQMAGGDAM